MYVNFIPGVVEPFLSRTLYIRDVQVLWLQYRNGGFCQQLFLFYLCSTATIEFQALKLNTASANYICIINLNLLHSVLFNAGWETSCSSFNLLLICSQFFLSCLTAV